MCEGVRHQPGEEGVALVLALMAVVLLSALGFALLTTSATETVIAANYRTGEEGFHAADAALELAMSDLAAAPDWNQLLDGTSQSTFIDSPCGATSASCPRTLVDGTALDLRQIVNLANCGKPTTCSPADLTGNATGDRPWGANNPVWQLYAYGKITDLLPASAVDSLFYVVVMVADDPSETDNNPAEDGRSPSTNPGSGVISVRAMAFGPSGGQKIIEATVARSIRILSWREVR